MVWLGKSRMFLVYLLDSLRCLRVSFSAPLAAVLNIASESTGLLSFNNDILILEVKYGVNIDLFGTTNNNLANYGGCGRRWAKSRSFKILVKILDMQFRDMLWDFYNIIAPLFNMSNPKWLLLLRSYPIWVFWTSHGRIIWQKYVNCDFQYDHCSVGITQDLPCYCSQLLERFFYNCFLSISVSSFYSGVPLLFSPCWCNAKLQEIYWIPLIAIEGRYCSQLMHPIC